MLSPGGFYLYVKTEPTRITYIVENVSNASSGKLDGRVVRSGNFE